MSAGSIKPWMYRSKKEHLALFSSFLLSFLLLLLLGIYIDFWLIVVLLIVVIILVQLEQAKYLGNAMRVHQAQFPDLYMMFVNQASKLGIKKANLYIIQDPYLNAHTIGIGTCSVVLHSALVEQLSTKELAFVIAHELGHYAAGHTKISSILIPIRGDNIITNFLFGFWQRQAEFTSDRCGLILTRDLDSVVTAIIKLTVGGKLSEEVNLEGYFKQVKKASSLSTSIAEISLSHPLITNRIKQIIAFWKENFKPAKKNV